MHIHQPVKRPLEKGFSLIEFMIAITISMIILLAASIAWQSGLTAQKGQSDVSRLNETARFAIDLLSREIRQAGLINKAANPPEYNFCSTTSTLAAIAGVNDPATINPADTKTSFSVGTQIAVSNLSDAIRVRYYGDNTGQGGVAGGTSNVSDCLGNPIANPAANTLAPIIEDTLYVASDPNNHGEPALWCHTSNPPPNGAAASQPIVAGVESLQLLYGVDLDGDGIVNQYVPAQLVTSSDNVLSVKASVVARSANAVSLTPSKTYQHFGQYSSGPATANNDAGTTFTPNPQDNRLRLPQPLSTEIAVRNFSSCSALF